MALWSNVENFHFGHLTSLLTVPINKSGWLKTILCQMYHVCVNSPSTLWHKQTWIQWESLHFRKWRPEKWGNDGMNIFSDFQMVFESPSWAFKATCAFKRYYVRQYGWNELTICFVTCLKTFVMNCSNISTMKCCNSGCVRLCTSHGSQQANCNWSQSRKEYANAESLYGLSWSLKTPEHCNSPDAPANGSGSNI